jgi:hypothetical protein
MHSATFMAAFLSRLRWNCGVNERRSAAVPALALPGAPLAAPFSLGSAGLDEKGPKRQVTRPMSSLSPFPTLFASSGAAASCVYYYALARAGPD